MVPCVYIIILNWNNCQDTIECVETVKNIEYGNFYILIVDNASSDDSVKRLRDKFPDIGIIENEQNFGFAKGNNIGIRFAIEKKADYVFILNNDTAIQKDSLKKLIGAAEENKDDLILAPKVYYYNQPDVINSLGTTLNWLRLRPNLGYCGQTDKGQFNTPREAEVLVGCALLMKTELLKKTGLFDEKFYMIHEDADLCLRNIKNGGRNIVVPEAVVYHKASAMLKRYSALSAYYSIRNFLYLAYKHASFLNKQRVFSGLLYLMVKNLFNLLFNRKRRKATLAFFFGIRDYFLGNMDMRKRPL